MLAMDGGPQIPRMCWDGSKPARRGGWSRQGLLAGDEALLGSLDEVRMPQNRARGICHHPQIQLLRVRMR